MQRQVITRIAAPLARQAVGVQRRGFVGGLVNKSNKVVETQKFMQRQGVAVGADAPTFLRKGQSDKVVAMGWGVTTALFTLLGVKMVVDMTFNWNKREI